MNNKSKIVLAISGASGSIYAERLMHYFNQYSGQYDSFDIVFSKNAKEVWKYELQNESYLELNQDKFENDDFYAPFASGSADYDIMIICPASMGTIGRIANGISDDLISRAADVMLKERKQLIVVARETPYNLIHIRNMTQLTEAGAVVIPASPSFYSRPQNIIDLVDTVVLRILQVAGFKVDGFKWSSK